MGPEAAAAFSEGRLKRQITGRSHRFALVFTPGLEAAGAAEARERGLPILAPEAPGLDATVLEWEGRLVDLCAALASLQIPSRIFVRLARFRCGAREELFKAVYQIPWELWLRPCRLQVEAHVAYSRISHEGMAARTVEEAVRRRWQDAGLALPDPEALPTPAGTPPPDGNGPAVQRLVLRLENNHAVLSLDCAGDGLWQRGWRRQQGAAPLRETIAAGLLACLGWTGRGLLVDGMCGSGTLAIEAAIRAAGASPWHPDRRLACQDWPGWPQAAWAWNLRQARPVPGSAPARILALDWHQGVLAKARENWQTYLEGRMQIARAEGATAGAAGSTAAAETGPAAGEAPGSLVRPVTPEFRQADFFALDPAEVLADGGTGPDSARADPPLLILNPPYGLRLDDGGGNLYPRLWAHLDTVWRDWRIGVLAPDLRDPPQAAAYAGGTRFLHGGLHINFWIRQPRSGPAGGGRGEAP